MGRNVVRLVRAEHQAMQELLIRCGPPRAMVGERRPKRRAERDMLRRLLAEVDAHLAACRRDLYPAAADPTVNARVEDAVADAAAVQRLSRRVDAGEADVAALGIALSEHDHIERRTVLNPLEDRLDVPQLRRIGEQFSRDRDAHLRADPRVLSGTRP